MYEYTATVVNVHDGDTVRLDIDLGFSMRWETSIRLAGINAPELVTKEGKVAAQYLSQRLPVGSQVRLVTIKDKAEKYGRILGRIYIGSETQDVNAEMISKGMAVPYMISS